MIVVIFLRVVFDRTVSFDQKLIVEKWETYQSVLSNFWFVDRIKLKRWIRNNSDELPELKPGTYEFTWNYSYADFFAQFSQTPDQTIEKVAILEWRSSYDIDAQLTKKWLINEWEYRKHITDAWVIEKLALDHPFLSVRKSNSLEGFLYPDTYFLNPNNPIVPQLVKMQLDAFEKKVRTAQSTKFEGLAWKIKWDWMEVSLSPYWVLTLASVVEREERNVNEQPTVAWIFLNRLNQWMRLDADITVCYGLQTVLDQCNPTFVSENITKEAGWYNTRVVWWLPPTPISNPSAKTIWAVLDYKKSDYIFYLHDNSGIIHYWITVADHEKNKNTYLR